MRRLLIIPLALVAALAGAAVRRVQDQCGPFTDVSALFCPYVLEAYYTGITAGTSPTTFSPDLPITRGQAAVFTTKALNQALARGSRRAALGQWWMPRTAAAMPLYYPGFMTEGIVSDGSDVWVAGIGIPLARIHASDGKILGTWSGTGISGTGVLSAMGRIFIADQSNPGKLHMVDPSQPPGPVTTVASDLGQQPMGLAFDGSRIWTANLGASVSIVTPSSSLPWPSVTVSPGLGLPVDILFDGHDIWVVDQLGSLYRLDSGGAITQTVPIQPDPGLFHSTFDGTNIWVPARGPDELVVVRASTGEIVARLTGNGLESPYAAAFDGERILVTNAPAGLAGRLSVWRAADLAPLGSVDSIGGNGYVCSDGIHFWISWGGVVAQF